MASLSRVPAAPRRHPHTRVHRRNPNRRPQRFPSSASCCSTVGAPLSDHAAVPPSASGCLTARPHPPPCHPVAPQPPHSAIHPVSLPASLRACRSSRHPHAHSLAPPPRHFGSATSTSPHHRLSPTLAAPLRDLAHKPGQPNVHPVPSSFGIVSSTIPVTSGAKASKAAADAPDRAAWSCSALTTLVHPAAYLILMELDRPARMREMREDGGA
ncbi:hypothetical protein BS78_08G069600 [Paspalum vaginatum]|nr:hypothetical protein BS78_08G069600 [Paspalum vaginatum]